MADFFPIRFYANEQFSGSIAGYRDLYLKTRRQDTTWYNVDVQVLNPNTVLFIVFSMCDNVYGGQGDEIYRYEATIRPEDKAEMIEDLLKRALVLGEQRLKNEEDATRVRKITEYANEMLGDLL